MLDNDHDYDNDNELPRGRDRRAQSARNQGVSCHSQAGVTDGRSASMLGRI
jgi:hypothetical protein